MRKDINETNRGKRGYERKGRKRRMMKRQLELE